MIKYLAYALKYIKKYVLNLYRLQKINLPTYYYFNSYQIIILET